MKANVKNQERVNAVNNLRNANKESKSISGCIKIIAKLWGSGYNEAFSYFGITFKQLDIALLDKCQKDEQGNVYIVSRKARKDEQGNNVLNEKGKKEYDTYNKVVTTWTPATLWKVLEQSINK
jgi:hypothetical protein